MVWRSFQGRSPQLNLCDGVWNLKMWWGTYFPLILPWMSTRKPNQIFIISYLPATFQPSFYLQCSLQLCILLSKTSVSLLFGVMSLQGGLTWMSHQSGLVGIQTRRIVENRFKNVQLAHDNANAVNHSAQFFFWAVVRGMVNLAANTYGMI